MAGISDFVFESGGEPISLRRAFEVINENFDAVTKLTLPTAEPIPPNSVCYVNAEGLLAAAGSNVPESAAPLKRFSPAGASTGEMADAYQPGTTICLNFFNGDPGFYWLGQNGSLVTEMPTSGYTLVVGEVKRIGDQTLLNLTLNPSFIIDDPTT